MVEVGALARAVELTERVQMPPGLDGDAALGWQAGMAAAVTALRTALEHQAGLLPSPAPPPPAAPRDAMGYRPSGIDWSPG
jgi:hypothetical protein